MHRNGVIVVEIEILVYIVAAVIFLPRRSLGLKAAHDAVDLQYAGVVSHKWPRNRWRIGELEAILALPVANFLLPPRAQHAVRHELAEPASDHLPLIR